MVETTKRGSEHAEDSVKKAISEENKDGHGAQDKKPQTLSDLLDAMRVNITTESKEETKQDQQHLAPNQQEEFK